MPSPSRPRPYENVILFQVYKVSDADLCFAECLTIWLIIKLIKLDVSMAMVMAKDAFNKKRALCTSTVGLELRKKRVKCYIWSIALYGAETGTLRAVDQRQLESFEMWCWRRMEKIVWSDHVRNENVLLRVKEQRNILDERSNWKANWIGHILCRNCLLQRVIEGKIKGGIEVTGR